MKPTLIVALLLSLVTFAPAHAADQPATAMGGAIGINPKTCGLS